MAGRDSRGLGPAVNGGLAFEAQTETGQVRESDPEPAQGAESVWES